MSERPPRTSRPAALFLSALLLSVTPSASTQRQTREHLTPEEIELVRDSQELDKRTDIFVKAVERRLMAMSPGAPAAAPKKAEKGSEKLGVLPPSTRAQFLYDIAKILDEASVNIDDAGIHSEKSPQIPKALRRLAQACQRFLPQLTALRDVVKDEPEREWLEKAAENAQDIIDAAGRLAPDEPEQTKGGKKGKN